MAVILGLSNSTQITKTLNALRDSMAVTQPSGGTQGTLYLSTEVTIATHNVANTVFQGLSTDGITGERLYIFTADNDGTPWIVTLRQGHIKNYYWEAKDAVGVGIVSGAITAGSGNIAGATVTLTKGAYSQSTTSAATTGAYSFTGVPQDTWYTVAASKTGYTGAPASVDVTENTTTTQNLVLVEYGSIAGTCLDDAAADLDDATVTITKGAFASSTTSASGAYEIIDVPADTGYTLTVTKANYVTGSYTVDITEAAETTQNVVASRYGSISGTVTDETGNVEGATVEIYADGTTTPALYTATTVANGTYAIANVAPATYDGKISKANHVDGIISDQAVVAATDKVIDKVLVEYANYGGTITVAGPTPVEGVTVEYYSTYPGTPDYTDDTNASGEYAITNIVPGTYQVKIHKTGYITQFAMDRVVAGDADVTNDDWTIVVA